MFPSTINEKIAHISWSIFPISNALISSPLSHHLMNELLSSFYLHGNYSLGKVIRFICSLSPKAISFTPSTLNKSRQNYSSPI